MIEPLRARTGKSWFNELWRFGVTALIAGWILTRLDLGQLTRTLIAPRWDALLAMIGAAIIFALIGALKVWTLIRALAPIRVRTVLGYFLVATSLGAFTPAALGDFSIAGLLRREGIPLHQGLAVMFVDRVVTVLIAAFVFAPLTLWLFVDATALGWMLAAGALGMIGLLALNVSQTGRAFFRDAVIRRFAPPLENFARTLSDLMRTRPVYLTSNLALALVRALSGGMVVFYALHAASAQPEILPVICATNFLTLINLVPISVGGVGVYEGGGVLLFEQFGMAREQILAGLVYQRLYILLSAVLTLLVSAGWAWRARGGSR